MWWWIGGGVLLFLIWACGPSVIIGCLDEILEAIAEGIGDGLGGDD